MRTRWRTIEGSRECHFSILGKKEESFPEKTKEFLEECSLLYYIPLLYLIPDSQMIGKDQLRFFTIDHNWMRHFIDGVCSAGRNASVDAAHDKELLEHLYASVLRDSEDIRLKKQGKGTVLHKNKIEGSNFPVCSGFLLCSELVRGWRGLEFKAYASLDDTVPLTTLRLDVIREDLLLGIFRGEINRLDIGQPPEGLHFGFERIGDTHKPVKTIRDLKTGSLMKQEITVALKEEGNYRVVDVAGTNHNLEAAFGGKLKFTSAEFALEMIQNAYTGVFTRKE